MIAGLLTVAFASDLLDGAVARRANLGTRGGALLDSVLDRCSDLLVFLACAIHFSIGGNVTYVALSVAAAANAMLISYIKARAENFIDDCGIGYWQRGERCGLFLVAAYLGHIPAALWVLGTLPAATVFRRFFHARRAIAEGGNALPVTCTTSLLLWRHPRGSPGYDVCVGVALAFVIAGPLIWSVFQAEADPLRELLLSIE